MATTSRGYMRSHNSAQNSFAAVRSGALGLAKVLFLAASQPSSAIASPIKRSLKGADDDLPKDLDDPDLWLYLGIATVLVLLGGAFAGLTIALMGQDAIYLQVIAASGEGKEQKHAQQVYRLLKRGKHWVLVTLLLANVIVNETLPIILDRSLGGGWPAVLGSTALIVIFGEVIPQSICVRYGMQIGSFMSPWVLVLMYILAPIAWPTAQLLDWLLGEDHGTVYKKSGLKTLVTLHKTLGTSPSDRLNQDEVTIISAVLDLKDKPVGDIMTPMEDVFTMSADTVLDEQTMDAILSAGYSRIPIFEPGNKNNFIGMLLVKILITYDPEDCKKVGEFALATLPETRPETSCLDIVNFFQEGKSHMVLVSEFPGEDFGAMGVVTLEDVIEELIGEEIIDESDVYIDVHKAIRRMAPAPTAFRRAAKGQILTNNEPSKLNDTGDSLIDLSEPNKANEYRESIDGRIQTPSTFGTSPKATFVLRRGSNSADGNVVPVTIRGNANDMREHLKHLGPSNLASRPKSTRYNAVKIKPGNHLPSNDISRLAQTSLISEEPYHDHYTDDEHTEHDEHDRHQPAAYGGEGEGLLRSAGKSASDGVLALHQGYGSTSSAPAAPQTDQGSQINIESSSRALVKISLSPAREESLRTESRDSGTDTIGSLKSKESSPIPKKKKSVAKSGSITENIVDANGMRKVVLQTTSSSDGEEEDSSTNSKNKENVTGRSSTNQASRSANGNAHEDSKKKQRRRRKRKGAMEDEDAVLPSGSWH